MKMGEGMWRGGARVEHGGKPSGEDRCGGVQRTLGGLRKPFTFSPTIRREGLPVDNQVIQVLMVYLDQRLRGADHARCAGGSHFQTHR